MEEKKGAEEEAEAEEAVKVEEEADEEAKKEVAAVYVTPEWEAFLLNIGGTYTSAAAGGGTDS